MPGRKVKLKRAYDAAAKSDGRRVLIDGLWPRGVSKDELRLDDWLKDLAPSARLRTWFAHDPAKWSAFKKRYFRELDGKPQAIERLVGRHSKETLTLVFAAKDIRHNNAVALEEYLERFATRSS